MPVDRAISAWIDDPDRAVKSASVKIADDSPSGSPPNYRAAKFNEGKCAECEYFDTGRSLCTKFDTPVQPMMTCDDFEKKSAELSGGSQPIMPATPVGPQAPLSPGQEFKFAFLYKCASQGLTLDETAALANDLADQLECGGTEKKAVGPLVGLLGAGGLAAGGAGQLIGGIGQAAQGLGSLALPLGIGLAAPGWFIGSNMASAHHDANKEMVNSFNARNLVSVDDFKNLELINEYKNQAELARKSLQDRRREMAKTIKSRFDRSRY